MPEVEIQGRCDPRFTGVREAFTAGLRERDEVGAAVALVVAGERVVDLWAGHLDRECTRPWQRDTLVNVYSTTEGRLDFDAPVARYWAEFAPGGKGALPVRFLLSHRAGLPEAANGCLGGRP